MNFKQYQILDNLISCQDTGTVENLAQKLNVSTRTVKRMIRSMKEECRSPIHFDIKKQSYVYTAEGSCRFIFQISSKNAIAEIVKKALDQTEFHLYESK